ncbi:hypothetical protein OKW45_003393 [Paraburkholderia sp. WSM4175]
MASSQSNVSPLRQRMSDDMRMRQLAPKTQDIYLLPRISSRTPLP